MKVRECMCNQVNCINPETTVCEAAKIMLDKHVGCIPVCDSNKNVVGLVTDRDLILRTLACQKDANTTKIRDVMTTKVYNISPEANIEEASKMMCDCQIRRVPVVENDVLVGIITLGDLANNEEVNSSQVSNTIEGICRCGENTKNNA